MVPVTERKPIEMKEIYPSSNISSIKHDTNNSGFAAKCNSGAFEGDSEDEGGSDGDKFSFYKLWKYTGPGWLMSIAYLDPGNIAGDLQAGTNGGYGLIWSLALATFCGLIIQILAARLAIVTNKDLATQCREQFSKPLTYALWFMAEIAIIGSDIQEVIGTAIALKILFGIPLWLGAIITICDTFTFLFIHYCGVRKLEALFIVLVGTMAVCFCINMIFVEPELTAIIGGFIPQIPTGAFDQMIGLVGAVIMPHNLFLHSALVLSREIDRSDKKNIKEANFYFSLEAMVSLSVSFFINMSVICTFAYWHFRAQGEEITLQTAHSALRETFGEGARLVWAIGLLAAGQSSTMTGTYAGQFVMQGFLKLRVPSWAQVGITRSIAIFPSLIVAFTDSIDELDGWINILQAIQLPFALIPLLKFTSSENIMKEFKNPKLINYFTLGVSMVIIAVNLGTVMPTLLNTEDTQGFKLTKSKLILIGGAVVYFSIIIAVLLTPTKTDSLLDSSYDNTNENENCDIELNELLDSNSSLEKELIQKYQSKVSEIRRDPKRPGHQEYEICRDSKIAGLYNHQT